jgi:hypothetical protein
MRALVVLLAACTANARSTSSDAGRVDAGRPDAIACADLASLDTSCQTTNDCMLAPSMPVSGDECVECSSFTAVPINASAKASFDAIEGCVWSRDCVNVGCPYSPDAGPAQWRVICGTDSHCHRIPIQDAGTSD